jgi:TATA-box binding protein (TBP) (component of TFIID and TFIIIB)
MTLHIVEEAVPVVRAALKDSSTYEASMKAHDETLTTIRPSAFCVSTMTVVMTLSALDRPLDLERIDDFINNPENAAEATFMGHRMSTTVPESKESFYNQLTVRVRDRLGKRAVKIFVNGVLHITGCKSVRDAIAVGDATCATIEAAMCEIVDIADFKICMINSNFCTNERLRLLEVKREIEGLGKECSYDPEGYPAAKFKHGKVSIFVFATGKVIVTGGKTFADILDGYAFVTTFLDRNIEALKARPLVFAS